MPTYSGPGLPTRPLVRRELADGTYLLEGMKFSMTGWWEVKLALQAPEGPDKVTFNVVVDHPADRGAPRSLSTAALAISRAADTFL